MALSKQFYAYSIDTSCLYWPDELAIHKELSKLYNLRKKENLPKWKSASVNRLIKKRKDKLTILLNQHLDNNQTRELRPEFLTPKKVISLFDSALSRSIGIQVGELTEDIIILSVFFFQVFEDVVKKGFIYNGEKYVFLTASAGQIRTKKAQFIKKSIYEKVQNKLTCGLTVEEINRRGGAIPNKYLAYTALNGSATEPWKSFDIDKAIVVDDFETNVFASVDFVDSLDYSITRKQMSVPIPHSDGFGIMLDKPTRMIRGPFIKGLLVYFPYDKFIQEKCGGKAIVYDIYGDRHDIVEEGIRYILTKSQFKMGKYFDSWNQYKDNFKKYQCEVSYCNEEETYIPKSKINYQMLQTLSDMTDAEIKNITRKTQKDIDNIGNDYQTTMRLLGATSKNADKDYFQQGLEIYPELMRDAYSREIIRQTKKSLIRHAKSGRLKINGRYQFVCDDPYAFCEWLFLGQQNPQGLLANGEVYSKFQRDGVEVACLRSPHLYREWAIRTNCRNEELDRWFGETACVYTSCKDVISKYLMFD